MMSDVFIESSPDGSESSGEQSLAPPPAVAPLDSIFCAVTTAPRESYTLLRTIEQLIAAGFDPHVFAEPESCLDGVNSG
jgi:hypothetical protein